jgi:hypothetical protein
VSSEDLVRLERWQDAGGTWRVVARAPRAITVALCRCDAGEEVDRFRSDSAELIAYVGERDSSED